MAPKKQQPPSFWDPEALTSQKREWLRFQPNAVAVEPRSPNASYPTANARNNSAAPPPFFDQFIVAGASHTLAQRFAGASQHTSGPHASAVPAQVLVSWPPDADDASDVDVCSFCFPSGVPLARVPDVAVLAPGDQVQPHPVLSPLSARKPQRQTDGGGDHDAELARSPIASTSAAARANDTLVAVEDMFTFLLKDGRADGGMPVWGVCASTLEAVEASVGTSGALTKRCYVFLTRWPFFQLHFQVLHNLLVSSHGGPSPPYIPQEVGMHIARMNISASRRDTLSALTPGGMPMSPVEKAYDLLMARDVDSDGGGGDDDDDDDDNDDEGVRSLVMPSTPPGLGAAPAPESSGPTTPPSTSRRTHVPDAMQRILKAYQGCSVPTPGGKTSFRTSAHLPKLSWSRRARRRASFEPGEALSIRAESFAGALPPLLRQDTIDDHDAACVACLCHHLDVSSMMRLLAAVMLERQVLIICPRLGALTECMLGVLLLLRPFQYHSVFLPVLPRQLRQLLDAPVPFLVGMQRGRGLSRARGLIVANLYEGAVTGADVPRLPSLDALAAKLAVPHAALKASAAELAASDADLREHAHAFLAHVRGHLASLVDTVAMHSIADVSGGASERVAVLMKSSYVDSFDKADVPFISAFVETQMFSHVSDGLLSA
ncbi:UDENN domain-containing protein [Pycnococcus provasolii]